MQMASNQVGNLEKEGRKEWETTYREDRTKNTAKHGIRRQSGCSDEEVCINDIIEESQLLNYDVKSQHDPSMLR
jgi:hypothetical protein